MGERFNIDLPARFRYTTREEIDRGRELETYLENLSRHIDEMLKRLFNRTSQPSTWSIITLANNATPSIDGGRLFLSGGTTTITDFDDGEPGQIITIISEHAITITDGTNIFLSGSGNFAMQATDTLSLVQKADGKWYEIGRSDNT